MLSYFLSLGYFDTGGRAGPLGPTWLCLGLQARSTGIEVAITIKSVWIILKLVSDAVWQ